jgi:16S rRNA (cytosine967-C5)-methyltransferase
LGVNEGIPARAAAQAILSAVLRRKRPFDAALEHLEGLAPRDAGFARTIAAETLRRLGQIEAITRHFVPKAPPPHKAGPTLEILYAGICELLFLEVAPHAAVDAANRLALADDKARHFKPLINAVLRRVSSEGQALAKAQDAPRLNTPDWLWERWCEIYGVERTRAIAHAHATRPLIDVTLKDPAFAAQLDGHILFDNVMRLREPSRIEELPGFAEGLWWVQDAAASLPATLLGDVSGYTVIDLCSAPGGKTLQLAARGANVIAVERDGKRFERLRDNLARTRLSATLIEADMRDFAPTAPAPFVLLDAPCSATGTIRRHPDLPWNKNASDVNSCAQTAPELLEAAANMVAAGGLLVFAVCSLEPEEGEEQVAAFLRDRRDFVREPVMARDLFGHAEWIDRHGDLRTLPFHLANEGGMDGFFASRLRRL